MADHCEFYFQKKIYYANYGRLKDLEALARHVGAKNLIGSIIIMRYGRLYRGDKVDPV